ncbi:MAG: Kelch repeat-containing protein [Streptosporangiaceae bacterium]
MSDERQLRSLLTLAAEPPDHLQAPVSTLLARARRRRTRRTRAVAAASTAGVAAVVLLAAGLPPLIGSLHGARQPVTAPSGLFPARQQHAPSGPTVAQIARYGWSALPSSPLGPRTSPLLTWTGRELIEIGGPGAPGTSPLAAAAYTPATGRWHAIAPVPGYDRPGSSSLWPANGPTPVSVWTGRYLFVTSGDLGLPRGASVVYPVAAPAWLYDPATSHWTTLRLPHQLSQATGTPVQLAAAWTGRDIAVAGVSSGQIRVAFYDPVTGHWVTTFPALPAAHRSRSISLVAAGNRLVLWSLWYITGTHPKYGTDVLALGPSRAWRNVTGHWLQSPNPVSSPAYTGSKILMSPGQFWCGLCSHPYVAFPGYFADPVTLHRTPIPAGPIGQSGPAYLWTGRAILAVNTSATIGAPAGPAMRPGDIALFDPATRRWQRLPAAPGQPGPALTPLWTGTQLLYLATDGSLLAFRG